MTNSENDGISRDAIYQINDKYYHVSDIPQLLNELLSKIEDLKKRNRDLEIYIEI